jgi:hypothetical protein
MRTRTRPKQKPVTPQPTLTYDQPNEEPDFYNSQPDDAIVVSDDAVVVSEGQKNDSFEYSFSFDGIMRTNNEFEDDSQSELFNRWTGEILVADEHNDPNFPDTIDRAYSFWRDTSSSYFYSSQGYIQSLLPQPYLSRIWGVRPALGWSEGDFHAPSVQISSLIRGFLVRRKLRIIYRERFKKYLCPTSGYYYFEDLVTEAISWYKPRLARFEDMLSSSLSPEL